MSATKTYSIFCDGVDCSNWIAQEPSASDARIIAKRNGWKRTKLPNGIKGDLCPRCVREIKEGINPK